MGFTRLISLGRTCQCAHQLRRFTGNESAGYFDWLGVPHGGLIRALRANFKGCFELANLDLAPNGETVIDTATGISHRHNFANVGESKRIQKWAIPLDYPEQRQKMDYLAEKWFRELQSERILFVRRDAPSTAEAMELLNALELHRPRDGVHILFVIPPGHDLRVDDARVFIESEAVIKDWPGDDDSWSLILSKYWLDPQGFERSRPFRANAIRDWDALRVKAGSRDPESPLVLFHGISERAAGIRWLGAVAKRILEISPTTRVLFLIEGEENGLLDAYDLPVLTLPARQTIYGSPAWRSWKIERKRDAVKGAATGLLKAARPDLIVLDGEPSIFIAHQLSAASISQIRFCVSSAGAGEDISEAAHRVIATLEGARGSSRIE